MFFDILAGLSLEFDLVRGHILGKRLPSLGGLYALIHDEEKGVMIF